MPKSTCNPPPAPKSHGIAAHYRLLRTGQAALAWLSLLLGSTQPSAAGAEPQCQPATKAELRSAGGIPNATGGYSKEFFERIDSPKRHACQAAEQRVIERVLKDRSEPCGKGGLLKDTLLDKMRLQQAEEYQSLGGGYFFNEGCMAHNCLTRAFTVTDATGKHGIVGVLDCALSDTGQKLPVFPIWRRIVYLYSDFGAIDKMPDTVQRKIGTWVQSQEEAESEQAGDTGRVAISPIYVK